MVAFRTWSAEDAYECGTVSAPVISEYIPGEFYKRELPCLMKALTLRKRDYECLVIDGFVHLGGKGRKGLGRHLYEAMQARIPVVGVAKNSLKIAENYMLVFRGRSRRPLYVSAVGMNLSEAAGRVKEMAGAHRIPKMLKLADQLTKSRRRMKSI